MDFQNSTKVFMYVRKTKKGGTIVSGNAKGKDFMMVPCKNRKSDKSPNFILHIGDEDPEWAAKRQAYAEAKKKEQAPQQKKNEFSDLLDM